MPPDLNMTTSKIERHGNGWQGAQHADGGFPLLVIRSAILLNVPEKPIVVRDLVKSDITKGLHGYKDTTTSPIEDGLLNGVTCARAYWKGTLINTRLPNSPGSLAHGFVYVTWNPETKTITWIEGEDIDPYYGQTSKELEAAALTLKPN